ncbi:AraC family transcriptional regulator [Niallia sp.]|uniref:AraC family transcriptional regulator n=1 Tax=Niallia sp. TaxID=2837523 RepID=UPI00289F7F50|nr:AraC family transcriptional regulator [Niallia sp.]
MSIYKKEYRYAKLTAFYALNLANFNMGTHHHASCEIMYVTTGSCEITVNDQKFILKEKEFIFLDSFIPHKLVVNQQCTILNIEFLVGTDINDFDLEPLKNASVSYQEISLIKPMFIVSNDSRSLGYAIKDLINLMTNANSDTSEITFLTNILFQRMILELFHSLATEKSAKGMRYINKAIAFIQANLEDELSVPKIAEEVGINKSYLHQLFKDYTSYSIGDFISKKRLERACFLLINSNKSITEIAFQAGFNSRQYFSNTFEKNFSMPPRDYRKLHGQTLESSTINGQLRLDDHNNWSLSKMK